MAYSKIHAIKSTVSKAIDYITNPDKTTLSDGTQLVSSFGCVPETASIEFNLTAQLAKEIKGDYSRSGGANNLAYHMIQSFAIEDSEKITPQQVHQLGIEFVKEFLGDNYEYVISTHIDKEHIHNHIIFNSTSFKDYKKFRSEPFKTVAKIREISDRICEENGLSVIRTKGLPKSYIEWKLAKDGKLTWKETIKNKIDELIPQVTSYDEFVMQMKAAGFDVKEGKHIAFRAPEQERFVRGKRIGEEYTKENIINRISTERVVTSHKKLKIDSKLIFKKLTNGFILTVPNQDYLLYLNGETAKLNENLIDVVLAEQNYTIMSKGLVPQGQISAEQILRDYGTPDNDIQIESTDLRNEIPLSEYIKLRQNNNSEKLHKAAEAIAYSRTEGVVYYSDYNRVLSELKDKSYETKHTLMKLDDKVAEIKNVGKLLVTYHKYLPVRQELNKLKFAKFTRQKFLNKHQLELASLDYAERQLHQLGIDPIHTNKDVLIQQIKESEQSIKALELKADRILERIDKLSEAQSIVDDFVSDNGREFSPNRGIIQKKTTEVEI